ncbi:hypothetical protein RFI_37845, partial [Reticulomyxa filosa]
MDVELIAVEIHEGFERIHIRQAIEECEEKLIEINGNDGFDITDLKEENMDKKLNPKTYDIGWFRDDKLSIFVYCVFPLSETVKFHIWQFGSLSNLDEQQYILEMIKNWKNNLYIKIFMKYLTKKKLQDRALVSLRDIERYLKIF